MQQKNAALEALHKAAAEEKSDFENKQNELRQKFQKTQDDFLENKIQYEREIALSKQQTQFLQNKLNETQAAHEKSVSKLESDLQQQKEQVKQEVSEKIQRIESEKA